MAGYSDFLKFCDHIEHFAAGSGPPDPAPELFEAAFRFLSERGREDEGKALRELYEADLRPKWKAVHERVFPLNISETDRLSVEAVWAVERRELLLAKARLSEHVKGLRARLESGDESAQDWMRLRDLFCNRGADILSAHHLEKKQALQRQAGATGMGSSGALTAGEVVLESERQALLREWERLVDMAAMGKREMAVGVLDARYELDEVRSRLKSVLLEFPDQLPNPVPDDLAVRDEEAAHAAGCATDAHSSRAEHAILTARGLSEGSPSNGYFSSTDLAMRHGLDSEALRKRLERWRKENGEGWIETPNRKSRQPAATYQESAVWAVLKALKARKETSSERPA
ncbi:MAG: hypothetical protein AMXMBFR7_09580 [Planctomycetota bacterium]